MPVQPELRTNDNVTANLRDLKLPIPAHILHRLDDKHKTPNHGIISTSGGYLHLANRAQKVRGVILLADGSK